MLDLRKCPKGAVGDIQLEAILTPLMYPRKPLPRVMVGVSNPDWTQPDLAVLDVGCGAARLLAGLLAFPLHMTRHISYTGCEVDGAALESSRIALQQLQRDVLGPSRLKDRFAAIKLEAWESVLSGRRQFDYVYVVNVLHHVAAQDIPSFVRRLLNATRDGGYIIFHDFYFDGPPNATYALEEHYCRDSLFFGPHHLASFFAMSTQAGIFRRMHRRTSAGHMYDLYTFLLHVENELTKRAAEESVWNDDYFSYLEIVPGLYWSLEDMHARALSATERCSWIEHYIAHLARAAADTRAKWPDAAESILYRSAAEQWIDTGLDMGPWWPRFRE